MAVIVQTGLPMELLASIKKAIDDGHMRTWSYDRDGDFTHTPDQWKFKAWLRPLVVLGSLRLGIVANTEVTMSKALYGIYHGRFIEELLTHFDTDMSAIAATPMPLGGVDLIAA